MAVALSGGADSMALALLADDFSRRNGRRIIALTVDHGLRAESSAEAQQVAAWMHERGIEHHILTPRHGGKSRNLQEAARSWRYAALAGFCAQHGILHCLMAHNIGDNRETVMLHTARGETADGNSGMSAVRAYRGVRFLRPLLHIERCELEHLLRSKNAAWVEDPSNKNLRFARVRMREYLTGNAADKAMLDVQIAHNAAARIARDNALAGIAMRLVTINPLGFAELSLAAWLALEPALASQLLADCITTIGGATHRPRAQETARLVSALHQQFRKRTLQHCEVSVRGDIIRISRETARVATPVTLSGRGDLTWDNRFRVRYDLPPSQPLTLRALGVAGKKQLAAHRQLPPSTPSLWRLDELLCVPHATLASPDATNVIVGFAPAKPLAAAPFWWLNQ